MVAMSAVWICLIISGQNCGVELLISVTWGEWMASSKPVKLNPGRLASNVATGWRWYVFSGSRMSTAPRDALASAVSMARMFCASRRACSGRLPAKVSILVMWATYCSRSLMSLRAGAEVVVLLRQAEAALRDFGDLFGGVLEVLLLAVSEEDVDAVALQLSEQGGEFGATGGTSIESVDLVQHRLDGGEAFGLDERGVHAGLEVVADLLLVGRAGSAAGFGLLQDRVQFLRVDVVEHVEGVDVGLVGRDGVVRVEVAAGELVHVGAGVGCEIH